MAIVTDVRWNLRVVLILISLNAKDVGNFPKSLSGNLDSSEFVLLIINFLSSFYILEISPLYGVGLVKIFSYSIGCHFVLLTVSFALQKLFSFRRSHLLIVSLSVCAAGVLFRKWFPVSMHSSVLPTFSSMRFSVAGFMLRSLIHLDLSFVHGDRYGSGFL